MDDFTLDSSSPPPPYHPRDVNASITSESLLELYNLCQTIGLALPDSAQLSLRNHPQLTLQNHLQSIEPIYSSQEQEAINIQNMVEHIRNQVSLNYTNNTPLGAIITTDTPSYPLGFIQTMTNYDPGSGNTLISLNPTSKPLYTNKCKLFVSQTNTPLEWNNSWSGYKCELLTSNGYLLVKGSLVAEHSIRLETTNADITVLGHLVAYKNNIDVKLTYGEFVVNGEFIFANVLTIKNSFGLLKLNSCIEVNKLIIKNISASVDLNEIILIKEISIKATDSPININITDIKSTSSKISIVTTNAAIKVYIPSKFSGSFDIKTCDGSAMIVPLLGIDTISFCRLKKSHKIGKYISSKKTNHSLYIRTSNAPIMVYIQRD